MDDDDIPSATPTARALAGILGALGLVIMIALIFLGGQVSEILSNVGNSIPVDCCGSGDSGGSGGEQGGPADEPTGDGTIADAAARPPELLIIRTGELRVEVVDLPASVVAAQRAIARLGGYVASSTESAGADDARASVVYRIPADRWDDATTGIRSLADRVLGASMGSEEVTNQVVDLGARIANLRATEAALQAIMAQATQIPDVLEVQDQLTATRGEIERLVAQKESLEERAAFGTLTVVFELPEPPVVEVVRRGWDPAADVDSSVGTLVKVFQRGVSFGIWLAIVGLPIVLGFLVLAVGAWQASRLATRWRRRSEVA